MSTSYYRLIPGITTITLFKDVGHDKVTIFQNHKHCGVLICEKGTGEEIVLRFADTTNSVMHTYWGGIHCGTVVHGDDPSLSDDTMLISEYGEPLAVERIKARAGVGKGGTLGECGELFGYKDTKVEGPAQ